MDNIDRNNPIQMIAVTVLLADLHTVFLPRGWDEVDITRVSRPRKADGKVRVYYTCRRYTRKVASVPAMAASKDGGVAVPYTVIESSSGSVVVRLNGWSK